MSLFLAFGGCVTLFTTPVSAVSLTLSVPSEPLSLDIQPTNTFAKSSSASISAKTDAFAGYALTIKAKTDNNLTSSSNKIASIASSLTEEQYKGSGYTNTWGYQPSKINSSTNTAFLPGPTTSPSTIEKTSAKNDTENTYNIVLGAKADASIAQGEYKNTFVFSATANSVSYSITYNLNEGEWAGTSPQTGTTTENTIKLDSNTPTKDGSEFVGWCDQETTDETCGGTTYQPGGDYILTNGENKVTLWAMWKTNGRKYTINYHSNFGSPSGMPGTQTGSALPENYEVTISSDLPTLSGYKMIGWCVVSTNDDTCSDTVYQPGSSVVISDAGQAIDLYAMWHVPPATCNSTGVRLKDGKCWSASDGTRTAWSNAASYCRSPWHLPSLSEFNALLLAYYPKAEAWDNYGDTAYEYNYDNDNYIFDSDWGHVRGTVTSYWSSTLGTKSSSVAHTFELWEGYIRTSHITTNPLFTEYVRCVSN